MFGHTSQFLLSNNIINNMIMFHVDNCCFLVNIQKECDDGEKTYEQINKVVLTIRVSCNRNRRVFKNAQNEMFNFVPLQSVILSTKTRNSQLINIMVNTMNSQSMQGLLHGIITSCIPPSVTSDLKNQKLTCEYCCFLICKCQMIIFVKGKRPFMLIVEYVVLEMLCTTFSLGVV